MDYETRSNLQRFEGQNAIGSADLWGAGSSGQQSSSYADHIPEVCKPFAALCNYKRVALDVRYKRFCSTRREQSCRQAFRHQRLVQQLSFCTLKSANCRECSCNVYTFLACLWEQLMRAHTLFASLTRSPHWCSLDIFVVSIRVSVKVEKMILTSFRRFLCSLQQM